MKHHLKTLADQWHRLAERPSSGRALAGVLGAEMFFPPGKRSIAISAIRGECLIDLTKREEANLRHLDNAALQPS